MGREKGREKGEGWLRVWGGEKRGEDGIRTDENGVRMRYEG